MEQKICNVCGVEKKLDSYYKDSRMDDGRYKTCKTCINKARTERQRIRQEAYRKGEEPVIVRRNTNRLFECKGCGELKRRDQYRTYGKKGLKSPKCNDCLSGKMIFKGFEKWYKQYKDSDEVKDFLINLRNVTGINGGDDLLKKYTGDRLD